MKQDIKSRADIEQLLQQFYKTLLLDENMQMIFVEIAQIDLVAHLPILTDFWEQILLHPNGFKRNVLKAHTDLHQKIALEPRHFQYWLYIFEQTIDQLFEGAIAQKAKTSAQSIAFVIQSKLEYINP